MELIHRFPEIKDAPLTMGFSGQMHSLVLIDKAGNVLRPAILWNDGRTTEEVKELQQLVGEHLLKVEKNIPLEGFTRLKFYGFKSINLNCGRKPGSSYSPKITWSII